MATTAPTSDVVPAVLAPAASVSSETSTDTSAETSSTAPCPHKAVGRNSVWTTAGIIVADVVGAGILGMPVAVSKFGWLLGSLVLTAMLAMNVHISVVLWRVRMCYPSARTLGELATVTFAKAPMWQRRLIGALTEGPQMLMIFSILGLYLLSAAQGLGMIFYDLRMCLPQWAMFAGMLILPFAGSAREMGAFQWLIWLNIATLTGTVLIPLGYMAYAGPEETRAEGSIVEPIAPMTVAGVLSALSTFTFGMTSQVVLVEIIDEMKDPAELPKAYTMISAPFQWIAFMVAGIGGYYFIGSKAAGMIEQNIPFGTAFRIAAVCLATHMLVSYFIKGVVFCRAAQALVDPKAAGQATGLRMWASWSGITFAVLFVAFVVANVVPFFNDAVDLIGASFAPLICWILPIVFFLRMWKDTTEKIEVSLAERALLFVEFALACVLMVFGTFSTMRHIVEQWDSFGYPFACHCEGIWNTCACSAEHIGLADECAANPLFPSH